MSVTQEQKLDLLLKKVDFGVSKTDVPSNKGPTNEIISTKIPTFSGDIWIDDAEGDIPFNNPPSSDTTAVIVRTSAAGNALQLTMDEKSTPQMTWLASPVDDKPTIINWVPMGKYGDKYAVKVYDGDPANYKAGDQTTNKLPVAGLASDAWHFDYESGVLHFWDDNLPSGGEIWIEGYVYDGRTLDTGLTTNVGAISTNAGDISTNAGAISTNAGDISTNAGAISTNGTNFSNHLTTFTHSNIAANVTAIGVNAGDISTNAGDISTNAGAISTNGTNFSNHLTTFTHSNIAANVTAIGVNAGNISTNTGDISTNGTNFSNHLTTFTHSNIAANVTAIGVNAGDISTNTGDISTNAGNISSNVTAIGTKADRDLGNLEADTSINVDLLPNSAIARNLGSAGMQWSNLWIHTISLSGGANTIVNLGMTGPWDFNDGALTNVNINSGTIDDVTIAGATQRGTIFFNDFEDKVKALAPGSNGQFLQTRGSTNDPQWASVNLSASGISVSTGNFAGTFANTTSYDTVQECLDILDDTVFSNTNAISTNAGNISTNASGISTNAGNISSNDGDISTNAGNISTNGTNFSNHLTNFIHSDIALNTAVRHSSHAASGVSVVTTAFGGAFANNTSHDTVQECLDVADDAISTNASAISTNASGISTNAGDISTNAGNISSNTTNFSNHLTTFTHSNIAANGTAIGVNAGNISTNASAISNNTGGIDSNTGLITDNTGDIGTNASDIGGNAGDIASNVIAIGTKANRDLSNLQTTSINLSLIPSITSNIDLGDSDTYWEDAYIEEIHFNGSSRISAGTMIGNWGIANVGQSDAVFTFIGQSSVGKLTYESDNSIFVFDREITWPGGGSIATDTGIATNAGDISTNAGAISTNAGAISTNGTNFSNHLTTFTHSNIAANATAIGVNAGDISTNAGDISTNAGSISGNAGDIGSLATNLDNHKEDLTIHFTKSSIKITDLSDTPAGYTNGYILKSTAGATVWDEQHATDTVVDTTNFNGVLQFGETCDTSQECFDVIDDIVGKLVPIQPGAFPGGIALDVYDDNANGKNWAYPTGDKTTNMPLLCSQVATQITNNTDGGTIPATQGQEVVRVEAANVWSTTIQDVGPGNSGTMTAIINNDIHGSHLMTPQDLIDDNGDEDDGTYDSLYISDNKHHPLATPGFWERFDAQVKASGSGLGECKLGWNRFSLNHSGNGSSNDVYFVRDNMTASPALTVGSIEQNSEGSAVAYSSGIKHYGDGTAGSIKIVDPQMANIAGETYYGGDSFFLTPTNSIFTTTGWTLSEMGITVPVARQTTVATELTTERSVSITRSNYHGTGQARYYARNVNGQSSTTTVPSSPTILVKRGTCGSSDIDEMKIAMNTSGGTWPILPDTSLIAYRIAIGSSSDTPNDGFTSILTTTFQSDNALATYEAAVIGGHCSHNQIDYRGNYLPTMIDTQSNLSSSRSGNQFITWAFRKRPLQIFKIRMTGKIHGCWIKLPGLSTTIGGDAKYGWWDMCQGYNDGGIPGLNDSDGCADGTPIPTNSTISNQTYNVTFGLANAADSTSNLVLIRFKLIDGDYISSLYFEK